MFFLILLSQGSTAAKNIACQRAPIFIGRRWQFFFSPAMYFVSLLIATNGSNNERCWRVFRPTTTPLALNSPHKSISPKLKFWGG
jgi:hypothetical protein